MKLPSLKSLRVTAVSALAVFAAGQALAQLYVTTSNDNIKTYLTGGSYHDVPFFGAVATAVQNDAAVSPCNATAPVVASGFGTNAAVVKFSAGCTMSLTSGTTAASNGVVTLPQAPNGWVCNGQDVTTSSNAIFATKMTNETANSVTIDGFQSNGAAGNWAANDTIALGCTDF